MISIKLIVNVSLLGLQFPTLTDVKKMIMKNFNKFQGITFFSIADIPCCNWCIININHKIGRKRKKKTAIITSYVNRNSKKKKKGTMSLTFYLFLFYRKIRALCVFFIYYYFYLLFWVGARNTNETKSLHKKYILILLYS